MHVRSPASLIAIAALWLAAPAAADCSTPGCGTVDLPYALDFSGDGGGLPDRNGVGTGFTIVDQPSQGSGYRPDLLGVDTAGGRLAIETTPGIAYRGVNSLDNALGIGLMPSGGAFTLRTTLVDVPAVDGGYAQAGLWFGASEDDYVKLVVIASLTGTRVQLLRESGGSPHGYYDPVPITTEGASVSLRLRVDPSGGVVTGAYAVDGGAARQIRTMPIPPTVLYRGQHEDKPVATGGVFATNRLHPSTLTYAFDDFQAACVISPCTPAPPPHDPDFGDGDPPVGQPEEDNDPSEPDKPGTTPNPGSPGRPPAPGGAGRRETPLATLALPRRVRLSALRRRGLRGELSCSARCSFDARLELRGRGARLLRNRGAASRALIVGRRRGDVAANHPTRFTVRPDKRTRRRLGAVRVRTFRASLRVRVAFAPDTSRIIRRTVLVSRSARR